MIRIGQGFDVHQFVENRSLILGGVDIPFEKGLLGHSDADVLLHAITDSFLGALAMGDIGKHFPDSDPQYKDANSAALMQKVWRLVINKGFILGNIDATIIAEKPKLSDYILQMQKNIAGLLYVSLDQISIKATTAEKMGFIGREEGIATLVVVCLVKQT